jgi:hypothetical protein
MDVERTYADDPYFASFETRVMLQRILLLWCAAQPHSPSRVCTYRQGMNELLALIVVALRQDHSRPAPKEYVYPSLSLCTGFSL